MDLIWFHPFGISWTINSGQERYVALLVYDELRAGQDELATWVIARREYFVAPDEKVQTIFGEIADFVTNNYPPFAVQQFLDDADPWVIAQARHDKSVVVTNEILVPTNSSKIKIPNICNKFGVQWVNLYKMLRELNAVL